jgi:hypothetical protein
MDGFNADSLASNCFIVNGGSNDDGGCYGMGVSGSKPTGCSMKKTYSSLNLFLNEGNGPAADGTKWKSVCRGLASDALVCHDCPVVDCAPGYIPEVVGQGDCCPIVECVEDDPCFDASCPMIMCMEGMRAVTTRPRDPENGVCCDEFSCEYPFCLADAKMCPDGETFVSRDPYNGCAFEPCPLYSMCTKDVLVCPHGGGTMSRNPTNNCQFEACPDPCTLVHCGDHGSCNKDSPTFSNDQPCTCTDGYTGVSCQDAPTPRQHANLLYQSVLLVLTGINRAIRCDSGKCSYSDDVGKSWRTLGNTHSVLAGSPDGSVLWGVDADVCIMKSTDSGL